MQCCRPCTTQFQGNLLFYRMVETEAYACHIALMVSRQSAFYVVPRCIRLMMFRCPSPLPRKSNDYVNTRAKTRRKRRSVYGKAKAFLLISAPKECRRKISAALRNRRTNAESDCYQEHASSHVARRTRSSKHAFSSSSDLHRKRR